MRYPKGMSRPDPDLPAPADPLGETLHLLRLTGTLYCRGEFTAPWAVAIPRLEGMMTFLVVTAGEAWLTVGDGPPRRVGEHTLTLIPHGTPHVIASAPDLPGAPLFEQEVEKISERYECLRLGGGGAATRTMYGVVRFDAVAAKHLVAALPQEIAIDGWDDAAGLWMHSTLRFIAQEAAALKPGGETVLTRLADVIVIQAIRSWLERAPEAETGWLAALRDPRIGRALGAIHKAPGRDWTVAELARAAGLSRSVFAARFAELTGLAPMAYLTDWRMTLARLRLSETGDALGVIAEDLGYRSEAAFCRAFRRVFGQSPGRMRRLAPAG
jgi:AraC-like DNA-binding protein